MQSPLQQSAEQAYQSQNYAQAAQLYTHYLEHHPEDSAAYWQLGLSLLLAGEAEAAQSAWLTGLFVEDGQTVENKQAACIQVLDQAARQHLRNDDLIAVWQIRQQIHTFEPDNLENGLLLLIIATQIDTYTAELVSELNLINTLKTYHGQFSEILIKEALQILCNHDPTSEYLPALADVALQVSSEPIQHELAEILFRTATDLSCLQQLDNLAVKLGDLAVKVVPNNLRYLKDLSAFYQRFHQYGIGIQLAYRALEVAQTLPEQIDATKQVLKALMITGGRWQEGTTVFQSLESMIQQLIEQDVNDISLAEISSLINCYFFAPYYQDAARHNRQLQNQLAAFCQACLVPQVDADLQNFAPQHPARFQGRDRDRKLRIGYFSSCLRRHSVGWLCRSLFEYHDPEKFEIYLYLFTSQSHTENLQDWYISKAKKATKASHIREFSQAIFNDEIDILIELDSITMDAVCNTVMLKPAPIQVTWLGWDASGIPAVDYVIGDPYVMPDYAEEYYHETIYRLPQTYIAVDGFEVGLPKLRREDLQIPTDAIVYYSVQQGLKRHPETMRLQLEILKQVPGSYFCIKGSSDMTDVQNAFLKLADTVGVERDRLKFLDVDILESTHRANMGVLADIVLDTYPYNGATTTMETLWMGIPLVTWVGEQFSARNSYTMLKNVGVEAGIAHNAEEYVAWGVKFGTDPELRQKVAWRLRESRRDAPLWNGRQFAREMEAAYEQMWANYVAKMTA